MICLAVGDRGEATTNAVGTVLYLSNGYCRQYQRRENEEKRTHEREDRKTRNSPVTMHRAAHIIIITRPTARGYQA